MMEAAKWMTASTRCSASNAATRGWSPVSPITSNAPFATAQSKPVVRLSSILLGDGWPEHQSGRHRRARSGPNDWHIQGTGDFNGDGNSDVLWRHDSGQVYFWQMDG